MPATTSTHAFAREIPRADIGAATIKSKRFKEDCDIHTASQCCITTRVLTGAAYLDVKLAISIENDDKMVDEVEMRLRDILMDVEVEGKSLIQVAADVDANMVLVISATGADRDAGLANMCQYTAAWTMYTLVFTYKVSTTSVETALNSWFEISIPRPPWIFWYSSQRRA